MRGYRLKVVNAAGDPGAVARFARHGESGGESGGGGPGGATGGRESRGGESGGGVSGGATGDSAAELAWHRQVRELVALGGGDEMLGRMHDELVEVLRLRPLTTVVTSWDGAVERTYRDLVTALDG